MITARIHSATVEFLDRPMVRPLVLSSGTIRGVTEARASVRVSVGRREAAGRGNIYLSDLWAWPDPGVPHETRVAALRQLCEWISANLPSLCGGAAAHPLALGLRLHHAVCGGASDAARAVPSALARAMCLSPFDAAIHDAAGHALGVSAFSFYDEPGPLPEADAYFKASDSLAAIRRTLGKPKTSLPAWWIVGKNDPLDHEFDAVLGCGYRHFKLKILGKDASEDAQRTIDVFRAASRRPGRVTLSVDSNEGNPDAASVAEYLDILGSRDPRAYAALAYLEQPTGRDITKHRHDWREIGQRKPVMLDEGLTSLDLLDDARAQGWTGLALKTCKGHSFALVAAAWAKENGLLLSLQDLTNPGYSAIHAALLAARIDSINGVEINSPQFTPAANTEWLPRLRGFFEPRGGHDVSWGNPAGLGSAL